MNLLTTGADVTEFVQSFKELPQPERVAILEDLLGKAACRQVGIYPIPEGFKLSVVIPVYNEVRTIEQVIARVRAAEIPVEIVIVDDGSRDGTRDLLARLRDSSQKENSDLRIVLHERNQGKGAALKTGFELCTGDVVVVPLPRHTDDTGDPLPPREAELTVERLDGLRIDRVALRVRDVAPGGHPGAEAAR